MEGPRAQGPSLGRYHLAEALGGGPTGEVFRAKVYGVAGFERLFAVKRFYRALSEDPERMKLLSEAARRYQTIEHPRIARMHEFGVIDGQAFVAVELVPGVDLSRFIAFTHGLGAPPPAGAVLGMVAQLARAIAYAQGRGVLHLGISPTNVVATTDGDVKVMDFGFLRARLPARPADDATLAARLPYLTPEQVQGGPTSPATDVFQLASLAYELLSGRRAFAGANVEDTAARVVAGQTQPELFPPGVAEVLARAHNVRPEDRFGTAGAFADALDTAIRKAAQTGGRSDVGAAVRRAQQRTSEMEAQQFSGAVAFPMPSPPSDIAPRVMMSGDTPPPEPVPLSGDSEPTRLGDAPGAFTVGAPPRASSVAGPGRVSSVGSLPCHPSEAGIGVGLSGGLPLAAPELTSPGPLGLDRPGSFTGFSVNTPSVPHLPTLMDDDPADAAQTGVHQSSLESAPGAAAAATPAEPGRVSSPMSSMDADEPAPRLSDAMPLPPPPAPRPPMMPAGSPGSGVLRAMNDAPPRPKLASSGALRFAAVFLIIAALGGGGYLVVRSFVTGQDEPKLAGGARADAGLAAFVPGPRADAAPLVAEGARTDAGGAAAVGPGITPPPPGAPDAGATGAQAPPPPDGVLRFESNPPGATVYLDGAVKGKTPFEMPASGDRHKLALILPGHSLHRSEIDGNGLVKVDLPAVVAGAGPGKIKVRCKTRNRLYVIVNGAPTGEICPTERIQTPIGEVTVETYDPVTDSSRTHKVMVLKKTGGSLRVRLDD